MKKYAIIITCLALSAPLARSQAPSSSQNQSAAQNPLPPSASERASGTLPGPRSSSNPSAVSPATGLGSQVITNGAGTGTGTFGAGSAATQPSALDRNNSSTSSATDRGTLNDPSGASRPTGPGTPPLTSSAVGTDSSAAVKGSTSTARAAGAVNSGTGIPTSSATPSVSGKDSSTNSLGGSASAIDTRSTTAGAIVTEPSGASTESTSDRSLTQKLRQALNAEGSTTVPSRQNNEDLKITSRNGVVTLQGNVKNEGQKRSIEARLKNVDGVVSINNELKVSDKHETSNDSSVKSVDERNNLESQGSQKKRTDSPSLDSKDKSSQN